MNRMLYKTLIICMLSVMNLATATAQSPLVTVPPVVGTTVWGGVTFNVSSTVGITIDTIYVNTSGTAPTPVNLEVWYRTTPITAQPVSAEFTGSPAVYTSLIASQAVIGGTDLAPIVIPGGLFIPGGGNYGIYIGDPAFTNTGIRYGAAATATTITNGTVSITTGTNVTFGWVRNGTVTNSPRYFAGGVGYRIGSSSGGGPTTVPPIASFAYTKTPLDTVWVASPHTIVNTSTKADKSYWDILGFNAITKNGPYAAFPETRTPKTSEGINDVFIDTINNAVNFRYTFPDKGFYRVKVTALNKFGNDTYIDTIYVDTPATKPRADFFADKRVVGVYDFVSMFDLTNNGPVSWFWYLKPGYYNPLAPFFNSFSPSAGAQNPIINANEGGLFDVCLVASNYRGTDTMCKPGYIKIISGYEVCKGSSTGKDTIARENEGSAKLYTVGGKYVPNLIGTCSKGFTIATCSDTATLYIDRFRMRVGSISDSLLIRSGSSTGPVIARMGGTVVPAAFRTIKVPGGVAYLQTIINNPSSATPPGDSGYVVRWDAPPASYGKPTASFSMPDTVYDGYTVQFVNTTAGKNIGFAWDTNGDNVYGIDNPSSG
ncbi:MAG: hypothetical protein V4590_11100, partial [Bacteroidota bacterium]